MYVKIPSAVIIVCIAPRGVELKYEWLCDSRIHSADESSDAIVSDDKQCIYL